MRTIIKNGHILDPSTNMDEVADICIEDGVIVKIGKDLTGENADEVICAKGKYVMPGFIDLHVHFREPGFEYKETIQTGAMAAARGGYTSVAPMPNTKPVIDSKEMVEWLLKKEEEESVVHLLPVGAVTKGQIGTELADIKGMAEAGAKALSEDGKSVMDILVYLEGMKAAKENNLVVLAHCEDKNLVRGGVMNAGAKAEELGLKGITNAVEDVITARDIFLANETGVRLHLCHCSTKDSVAMIKLAKEAGYAVSGEVCPHHFTLADEDIPCDDSNYKMNPPLRSRADVEALKKGLQEGIMEVISTDHAPHSAEEKAKSMAESPFGIVGLETAFCLSVTELVEQGYLSKMQLVEKMSYNPAKIIGVDKGQLVEGKAADIVIADFDEEYTIDVSKFASKGKNTPFGGKKVKGRVYQTIVDGKVIYDYTKEVK
ncbi:MAG: dihydroorotase [Clostridiales bacterium]|nr:dihydroorotase [Clostridiales bacterium]